MTCVLSVCSTQYIHYLQVIQEQVQSARAQRDNRMATFEDEEKSRLLAELLASNNPQHLQAANRLIKNLVRAVRVSAVHYSFHLSALGG